MTLQQTLGAGAVLMTMGAEAAMIRGGHHQSDVCVALLSPDLDYLREARALVADDDEPDGLRANSVAVSIERGLYQPKVGVNDSPFLLVEPVQDAKPFRWTYADPTKRIA